MTGDAGSIWKRTGWFVEPENLPDLMASLGAIGVYSSGQQFAWRGHSSSDFAIESSLIRHLKTRGDFRKLGGTTAPESEAIVRDKELKIIEQARGWGLGIRDSSHVDDLQLLADLQHYGLPTRLIDFTSNPMTALWFAAQTPPDGKVARSGVLIALNVTNLKRYPSIGDPYAVAFEQE